MVHLRPEGWGQPITGPSLDMTQFVPGRKDEEVKPAPDGIPRVHVRVKITEEGDYFEDFIPWDIRDPYLKDPETFAISFANEFGLSMAVVEELARSIDDQLKKIAIAMPGCRLILSPEEMQAKEAKRAAEEIARKRESMGGGPSTHWRQRPPGAQGMGGYMAYPPGPGGSFSSAEADPSYGGMYPPVAQAPRPAYRPGPGRKKSAAKLEIPPEGLDETQLPIKRMLSSNKDSEALIDYYLENPPFALDQAVDALRAESIRVLLTLPAEIKIVQGMSCHGCKHTMDAAVLLCPKNIGSHSLCGLHFERFHGISDRDAKMMWETVRVNPAAAMSMGPLPVCLACSMSCPCKLCQRASLRRALDVLNRFINTRAGREPTYEGPDMPVIADIHNVVLPFPFIEEGVARSLYGDDRGAKRVPQSPRDASGYGEQQPVSHGRRKSSGGGHGEWGGAPMLMDMGMQPAAPAKTKKHYKKHGVESDDSAVLGPPPLPPVPAPVQRVPKNIGINLDTCVGCLKEKPNDKLLLCCNCPRSFHPACVRKLRMSSDANWESRWRLQPGQWLCDVCRSEVDELNKLLIPTTAEEGRRDIERDCKRILDTLIKHELASGFCEPVDLEVFTDYLDYVKVPMDLKTLRTKWFSGRARKGAQFEVVDFIADVRRVWHNCRMYNQEGSMICVLCDLMESIFEHNVKERIMPQLTPEAQVELTERAAELEKERDETMAELARKAAEAARKAEEEQKESGKRAAEGRRAGRGRPAAGTDEESNQGSAGQEEGSIKTSEDGATEDEEGSKRPAKKARKGGRKSR